MCVADTNKGPEQKRWKQQGANRQRLDGEGAQLGSLRVVLSLFQTRYFHFFFVQSFSVVVSFLGVWHAVIDSSYCVGLAHDGTQKIFHGSGDKFVLPRGLGRRCARRRLRRICAERAFNGEHSESSELSSKFQATIKV